MAVFDRWAKNGPFAAIVEALRDPDLDVLILDSTVVRAQHGQKKWDGTGGQEDQALGGSRGGFGTNIHRSFDDFGHPVELTLTPGQASDIGQATELLAEHEPDVVIADKSYNSDNF